MPRTYRLLGMLEDGEPRGLAGRACVDRALGVALSTARGGGRRRIIAALLERKHEAGLRALVVRYRQLDPADREHLAGHIRDLHKPIREAATRGDAAAVGNALQLIEDAGEAKLAYLVTERLRHGEAALREQAARCLLGLAEAAGAGGGGIEAMLAEDVAELCRAVGEAVERYEHHGHESVLRAMLALSPRPMTGAYSALSDAEHAATGPMRGLLSGAGRAGESGTGLSRALVAMLALPTCAPAAVAGLRRCAAGGTLDEAITGQEHLLEQEAVRAGLSSLAAALLTPGEPLLPDAARRSGWTAEARRAWVEWVTALPLDVGRRVELWREALTDPAAAVRVAAATRLMEWVESAEASGVSEDGAVAAARAAVAELAKDEATEVARLAVTWTLARRPEPTVRQAAALARDAGDRAGRGAALRLGPLAFERLWEAWPGLAQRDRAVAVTATAKLHGDLGQRLEQAAVQPGAVGQRGRELLACLRSDVPSHPEYALEAA